MTIHPTHEVLHALGQHTWVYFRWAWDYGTGVHDPKDASSWTISLEELTPTTRYNYPFRVCPICNIAEFLSPNKGWINVLDRLDVDPQTFDTKWHEMMLNLARQKYKEI